MASKSPAGDDPETSRCPVTGLPIFQKPEWIDVDFGRDYRVTLRIIGDRILHSRPRGYATLPDTKQSLELTRKIAAENFGAEAPYLQIEDYTRLKGSSLDARKYFIDEMKKREQLAGLIFCSASPLLKMSIKLAKRLNIAKYHVQLVNDYTEAVRSAFDLDTRVRSASGLPVE